MFHKAIKLNFLEGTAFELTFQSGEVKRYDISVLFDKYPQLEALRDRELFTSGRLAGQYGIIWNDELDLEAETVFEDGETVGVTDVPLGMKLGSVITEARASRSVTQTELASMTGIDQADISRIERGTANPSVSTLDRIASALGFKVEINMIPR